VADIRTIYKVFNTQQGTIIREKCAVMGEQNRHTETLKRKEKKTKHGTFKCNSAYEQSI
jgi:hypothetical protein